MPSDRSPRPTMTPAEYLAMERAASEKHEFFRGEVFAMAGASREHNVVVSNVVRELGNALRDRPCDVYPSDMRVKVEATGLYTYPDAIVVCAPARFEDAAGDTLLNPLVVFEVLSDSTEKWDRGGKFEQYRGVPGLAEFVLLSQQEAHVEHFSRQSDGSWRLCEFRSGGRVTFPALGCEVAVDDLYRRVFDPAARARPE